MTERQHDESLLSDLLHIPLTRDEEQALLREANQAGTPTLAPQTLPEAGLQLNVSYATTGAGPDTPASFAGEIVGFVRRNPIPALLTGMGLAYMLTRRRR